MMSSVYTRFFADNINEQQLSNDKKIVDFTNQHKNVGVVRLQIFGYLSN